MAEPAEQREDGVEQMVAAIAAKGDFPAAARVLQRLHDAVRRENCNALEVARVILDDPGVSSKILRVVNSSFYRPRGEPVSTITRAVFLLGFEAIRDLATGLVLLDEVARASGGRAAIRDLLHQCLICGSVSRALSAVVGHPHPEEAYLLGLFANWGRLCFAAYYPERYERALRSADGGPSLEHALGEEFGFGSDDLATAMLGRWNFPASYARYFCAPHAGAARAASGERLFAVVDVANEYAARAIAEADPVVRAEMDVILRATETAFGRSFDDLRALVDAAVEEAREHLPSLRTSEPRAGAPGRGRPAVARSSGSSDAAAHERAREQSAVEARDPTAVHATVEILAEISRAILAHDDINGTLAMVLEGVARTGGFDVAFLALLSGRKDRLVGRLGWGEGVTQYLGSLRVPLLPEGGVLAEAVLERRSCVVPTGASRVLAFAGLESLVVQPLVVRGKAIGVLVAARAGGRPVVGSADATLVQLFCNQAGLALDRAVS